MKKWISLLALTFAASVVGSPLTYFQRAAKNCPRKEFVEATNTWARLSGGYADATAWMQKCAQYPEAAQALQAKVKQDLFKIQNPPDIAGYLKEMTDSETKRRVARSWTVHQYLQSADRPYRMDERQKLTTIPGRLEAVALGRVENLHRSLCEIELDQEGIVHTSAIESSFWENFALIKQDATLTPEDHSNLSSIQTCLANMYADPSVGRDVFRMIIGTGFPEVRTSSLSRQIAKYEDYCRSQAVQMYIKVRDIAFQPPAPLSPAIQDAVGEMRAGCADELMRESMERNPLRSQRDPMGRIVPPRSR